MTALEKEKIYTSDEFLAMTELGGQHELIDGVIYDMAPAPSIRHQIISKKLLKEIDNYIVDNKGKCMVLAAPCDVKLDEYNTVQPDIFVVCDPDKLDEQKCNGAPDWVIEILSPSNGMLDITKKLYKYFDAGVREYWIVDPIGERVIVYPFGTIKILGIYTFDDVIPVSIYSDAAVPLSICINELMNK